MPDFLTLSLCFNRVCERRNLRSKAQKSQIWAGGIAGVKAKLVGIISSNDPLNVSPLFTAFERHKSFAKIFRLRLFLSKNSNSFKLPVSNCFNSKNLEHR